MTMRTALIVLLAGLAGTSAWAQARTAPPGDGPKPAMIVAGRALTPAAWAEGLQGDTVELDGVQMIWIGPAARNAGGSAIITSGPEGRILNIRAGTRSTDFVILPPGEFWRDPWVRYLIAQADIYELQPLAWWPYEEANIPSAPPHAVNWKRPYLDWKPDEAWLLLNLMPPPPPVEEVVVVVRDGDEEEPPARPASAPAPGTEPGMDPAMMDPGMAPPGAEPPPVP